MSWQKQNTFVNTAFYKHHEPGSGELGTSYTHPDGTIVRGADQLDPLGDDVGTEDPYVESGGGGDPGFNYPHFGDISDPHSGCTVDGQPWPCTSLGIYLNGSSGAAKSVTAGPDAGLFMPRYEWRFNDSPGGEDACKNGVCPSVVTIEDPGGYFAIAGFDIVTNAIVPRALVPLIPTPLDRDTNRAINNAFEALKKALAGKISENCQTNVIDKLTAAFKDFSLDKFSAYLAKGAGFFDGTQSQTAIAGTITTAQAGRLLFPGANRIADAFSQAPGLNAATSILASSFTTFLRPATISTSNNGVNGRNQSLLFHEGLHGYGGSLGGTSYFDSELQQAFGIAIQSDSSNISQHIADNCF